MAGQSTVTPYVALLRAVNVGGGRKLSMADLRAVVVEAGGRGVRTYIQSGNAVFAHSGRSPGRLRADLERRLAGCCGFEVPVVLRSLVELEAAIAANPFPGVATDQLHVAFCQAQPPAGLLERIDRAAFEPEAVELVGSELYLNLPNGVGRGKLPPVVARLPVPSTLRNWRTVTTLASMAAEVASSPPAP